MSILPRELASRFEVLEKMGEGGMGAVYKVRHNELNRVCVIKVMQAQLQKNPTVRARFLGEAQKGAQLNHPNIATVLDFFVGSNGTACLVMEFIDGKDLGDVLRESDAPLKYETAAEIVMQALDAVACLHAKKLVHRDISPDNLMITHDENGRMVVKLIDLGIAKSLEAPPGQGGTQFFIGKFAYAPPEQFGNHVDTRSDIYALGVVLYLLLTKTLPIVGTDFASYYAAHQKKESPRPFSETDPTGSVPENIRRVVLKALEHDAANRFQTATEFRDALRNALLSAAKTVRETPAPRPVSSGKKTTRNRTIGITVGSVILTVAGAILGWVLNLLPHPSSGNPPPPPPSGTVTVTAPQGTAPPPAGETAEPPKSADPKAAAAAITEGKKLSDASDMRGAYDAFLRATKADDANAFAWANLGGAAARLGKVDEAAHAYERSLQIDPDNWLAHYNLGCLFARAGDRDQALDHVALAIEQYRRRTASRPQVEAFLQTVRNDDALRELRNDQRFVRIAN